MIAHDLNAVAFAKLTDEQMAGLERCSTAMLKRFRDGERLFQAGDRDFRFFVVKSGKVEIIDGCSLAPLP
jgi:thioredoxin reductase (NADPH)